MKIERINIIGSGNLGINLIKGLLKKTTIVTIYSRHPEKIEILTIPNKIRVVSELGALSADIDLNIVAVKDDAIIEVLEHLPKSIPTVHTSGTVGIDVLKDFTNAGILYPLQTFSVEEEINIAESSFLLESNSDTFFNDLLSFCEASFSKNVVKCNSEERATIHLAAVFVNNFTNNMMSSAEQILKDSKIDFKILEPLIKESVRKALKIGPLKAQTGPAIRHDEKTMQKHLTLLKDEKLKEIYKLISQNIQRFSTKS